MREARDIIMAALHSRDGHALKHTHGEITEAILAALSSAGMAVVPVEPTETMHNAARDWSLYKYGKPIGKEASDQCYRIMIAAALPPLASGGG